MTLTEQVEDTNCGFCVYIIMIIGIVYIAVLFKGHGHTNKLYIVYWKFTKAKSHQIA